MRNFHLPLIITLVDCLYDVIPAAVRVVDAPGGMQPRYRFAPGAAAILLLARRIPAIAVGGLILPVRTPGAAKVGAIMVCKIVIVKLVPVCHVHLQLQYIMIPVSNELSVAHRR